MRFLRLDFGDDLYSLDLHPLITVVSGLSSQHQRQLFDSVRRLALGSTVGVRGLIEHSGVLVDLDGEAKERLEAATTTTDMVIYVDGSETGDQLVGLQAEIDQWERQAAIDAVAVEEIRADLDPSLKARVAELRRAVDPTNVGGGELEYASSQQVRYRAVRRAFDRVAATDRYVDQVDRTVADLLDRWNDYEAQRERSSGHLERLDAESAGARAAVEQASERLAEASREAKPVMLTRAEETRLEALFEMEGSEGKGWRRKGLAAREAAEKQVLLDKVGVSSWTEYSVFRMSPTASPEKQQAVAAAAKALEAAERRLEEVESKSANDATYAELDGVLSEIRDAAREVLGALVPKDIGSALRGLVGSVENPEWIVALNELRDILANNDLRPPYGFEPDQILGWTSSWLEAEARLQESTDPVVDERTPEELEEMRRRLAVAEQHLLRHRRALVRIERVEEAAEVSADRLERLRIQMAERMARSGPATADDVVAMVTPVARRVAAEARCSLPVIVAGNMTGLDGPQMELLMAELESLSQKVQIIVLTTRPEAITWANEVGLRRAQLANGAKTSV